MSEKKHTHVAVHAIQRRDEKGVMSEIAPGSEFTPASADERTYLEGVGAAKAIKKEVVAEEADAGKNAKTK